MIGVYKILSPSGKVYIGQSIDMPRRFRQYRYGMKNSHQLKLKASIEKHGFDAHEVSIMQTFPTDIDLSVLTLYEQFYIDQYKESGHQMMNIKDAGSNGKPSEESRIKISKALKGVPKKRRGHKLSPEHIEKIRKALIGGKMPPRSEQWYERQRIAQTGKIGPNKGRVFPAHVREKHRLAKIGKKLSPESLIKRENTRRENDIKLGRRNYGDK